MTKNYKCCKLSLTALRAVMYLFSCFLETRIRGMLEHLEHLQSLKNLVIRSQRRQTSKTLEDTVQLAFCAYLFLWGDNLLPWRRKSAAKNCECDGWLTQSSPAARFCSLSLWSFSLCSDTSLRRDGTTARSMPSKAVETLFLDTHRARTPAASLSGTTTSTALPFFGFGRRHGLTRDGTDGMAAGRASSRGISERKGFSYSGVGDGTRANIVAYWCNHITLDLPCVEKPLGSVK